MYTSIDIDHALEAISEFLRNHELAIGLPAEAIIAVLELIMCWNIFQLGDTYGKQLSGTTMGTPRACVYPTLYYAIHDLAMLVAFQNCLALYYRYIDDAIGIWPGAKQHWPAFKQWINSFGILRWTFTKPSLKIDYLDITIRIDATMPVRTNLFEKPLNLYLYLPPHSAQPPPGVLTGLVYGMIRRATASPQTLRIARPTYATFIPVSATEDTQKVPSSRSLQQA
jgi:hypothetical protein